RATWRRALIPDALAKATVDQRPPDEIRHDGDRRPEKPVAAEVADQRHCQAARRRDGHERLERKNEWEDDAAYAAAGHRVDATGVDILAPARNQLRQRSVHVC